MEKIGLDSITLEYLKSYNESLLKNYQENEMILGFFGGGSTIVLFGLGLFLYTIFLGLIFDNVEYLYEKNKDYKLKLKELKQNDTLNLSKIIENDNSKDLKQFKLSIKEKTLFYICYPSFWLEKLYNKISEDLFSILIYSFCFITLFIMPMFGCLIGLKNYEIKDDYFNKEIESNFIFENVQSTYSILKVEKNENDDFLIYYLNNNEIETIKYKDNIDYDKNLQISKSDLENKTIGYLTVVTYNKYVDKYNNFLDKNKEEIENVGKNDLLNYLDKIIEELDESKVVESITIKSL